MTYRTYFRFPRPIAANYDTPAGVFCISVRIPGSLDHVRILQSLIELPAQADFWDGTEAEQAYRAFIWEQVNLEQNWIDCVNVSQVGLQDRIFVPHALSFVTTGNAFIAQTTLGQPGDAVFQNPAQINDAWSILFLHLRKGQWNMNMSWVRSPAAGQLHLILRPVSGDDIVLFNNLEMYSATTGALRVNGATFDIPADAWYTGLATIPAKNASSSGYNAFITFFDFIRFGD
jgi:hypothetical protein